MREIQKLAQAIGDCILADDAYRMGIRQYWLIPMEGGHFDMEDEEIDANIDDILEGTIILAHILGECSELGITHARKVFERNANNSHEEW